MRTEHYPPDHSWALLYALRNGLVPEIGTEEIAVGLDEQVTIIEQDLDRLSGGWCGLKLLCGDCGTGKTFLSSLVTARAAERGFRHLRVEVNPVDTLRTVLGRVERTDVIVVDQAAYLNSDRVARALRFLVEKFERGAFPGVYLMFTGTPDFFDGLRGVPRPHLRLRAFNRERLEAVARKLRGLYPSLLPLDQVVGDEVIRSLGEAVTVTCGVRPERVPRLFFRAWIDLLDRADQCPNFQPLEFLRARGLRSVIEEDLIQVHRSHKRRTNGKMQPWHLEQEIQH